MLMGFREVGCYLLVLFAGSDFFFFFWQIFGVGVVMIRVYMQDKENPCCCV
jgi:hypothetical protein